MDKDSTIALPWARQSLTAFMKVWIVLSVCLAAIVTAAPLLAPSPLFRTVFNDAIQVFVSLVLIGLFACNAFSNRRHVRVFCFLTSVAMSVWTFSSSLRFFIVLIH